MTTSPTAVEKRLLGQFFTTTNPFVNEPFVRWFRQLPANSRLLEPFAGANNIVWMLRDLGYTNSWSAYDIDPVLDDSANAAPDVLVNQADTLVNYPTGFTAAITNPPYLAKNSATRRGLAYAGGEYDDLYKKSLAVMLEHTPFVAAIIPESFLTSNLFHDRLSTVVSLTCRMFEDTEVPVCLALFVPAGTKRNAADFEVWSENRYLGQYQELKAHVAPFAGRAQAWVFNHPQGQIGLCAIDNNHTDSIAFCVGARIEGHDVKPTSRSVTRVYLPELSTSQAAAVIEQANVLLAARRAATRDVFMTAFKGLRSDGKYRRRLDYTQARDLLNEAYAQVTMRLAA